MQLPGSILNTTHSKLLRKHQLQFKDIMTSYIEIEVQTLFHKKKKLLCIELLKSNKNKINQYIDFVL